MLEIFCFLGKDDIHRIQIGDLCHKLPCHKSDAVIIDTGIMAKSYRGKDKPLVLIETSVDISNQDLIAIANHFVPHLDVSIRNGEGRKASCEKGKKFEQDCLDPVPPRQPRGAPKPQPWA